MVDQVNPTGNLAPVLALTSPVTARPQLTQSESGTSRPSASRTNAADSDSAPVTGVALGAAAKQVNDFLKQTPADLSFQMDTSTGQVYFKVVDPHTREVVMQVPSAETLAMARKLRSQSQTKDATGVLVDKEG